MIKVIMFAPNGKKTQFDMDYYCNKHLPMVMGLVASKVKSGALERGLTGSAPGTPAEYLAMGHLYFDSVEDFHHAFGINAEKIMGDIPNFTNNAPVIQISEVVISRPASW